MLSEDNDQKGSQLRPHEDKSRWERVKDEDSDLKTAAGDKLNVLSTVFIPVEDYVYPNSSFLHLGQSVSKLSDLRFPPDISDLRAFNGGEITEKSLQTLYDEDLEADHYQALPENEDYLGKGKIFYLSQAYLENTPGWYRVVRKESTPYLHKVRTPGNRAVLDSARMPHLIQPIIEDGTLTYRGRFVDWGHRESGDEDTNRGPGIFFNPTTGDPQESKIRAMAFYRDRLFMANKDTIISSRAGDWDSFFLTNPDNIINSDPLDLMVSSNNYTPITHLIPFRDFLFVGTDGNTQYELVGSNNIISPLTAEFAPTAFYPMLPNVPPQQVNNNLFFYSAQKLFIYFGQRDLATEQAFEVSKHIPKYLPNDFNGATTSSHSSMIFALSNGQLNDSLGDNKIPNILWCYRNQIAGEKVVQNAFFKWTLGGGIDDNPDPPSNNVIRFIKGSGRYLYAIGTVDDAYEGESPFNIRLNLSRMLLDTEAINTPRLDFKRLVEPEYDIDSVVYDPASDKSTITFQTTSDESPYTSYAHPPFFDQLVTTSGEVLGLTMLDDGFDGKYTLPGNWDFKPDGEEDWYKTIRWVGEKFKSSVTLSPIYLRDDVNNIVPGTLNLRHGLIQTYNSKALDVSVSVNNRSKKTHRFFHDILDDRWKDDYIGVSTVTGEIAEHQVRFPVLGFTADTKIEVTSDNPHPLNIASLQFSGKFKPVTRYHSS